ncbi:tRNA (guanine(9)-N(1))-methyltransferase [Tulasnella sp. 418]|nr:tRNA (guanine(9)-N(1))-methyltransferase [Tulasnella sp. 418]
MAQLPTRKVLTVNQVFDILIRWLEERDWEKALFDVMPKRKFRDGPKKGTSENGEEQDIDENEASDDPEVES